MRRNRIIASFIIGIVGALIGGYLGMATAELTDNPSAADYMTRFSLPSGAATGFVLCMFLSLLYLRFMEDRDWQSGLGFGPLFGALAGALSGFITGVMRATGESAFAHTDVFLFLGSGFFGAFLGAVCGIAFGFIISLLFGPFLIDRLTKVNKKPRE